MSDDTHEDVGGPGEAAGGLVRDADVTRTADDRGSGEPTEPTQPGPDARELGPPRHGGDTPGTGAPPGGSERPVPETGTTFGEDSQTT
jgi:hypothetical protein